MSARRLALRLALAALTGLFAAGPALAVTVPQAVSAMGREMDRQLVERFGQGEGLSMFVTTPVNVNNLEEANPLARQVQEEISRWFVQAGYTVQEIRQGAEVLFEPETGELLLTRHSDLLGSGCADGPAVLAGTYVVSSRSVRFNLRLVHIASRQVLAMSTMTVPINAEVSSLLRDGTGGGSSGAPVQPTVITLLP